MLLKELSPADLALIANDIQWVRERWLGIPNVVDWVFDGGMDNLKAIQHVEYEHLERFFTNPQQFAHRNFAMVFGNILVRQLGFEWVWGIENKSRLLLRHSARRELIDIVRLIRNESERAGWRCPDLGSFFARIQDALREGREFPIDNQAIISPQTSPPSDTSPPPQSSR